MNLRDLKQPKSLVIAAASLALVVAAALFLVARDSGTSDVAEPDRPPAPRTSNACDLWSVDELQEWLGGSSWELDQAESSGPTCSYREVDGPGTVSVVINDAPNAVIFSTLRTGREAAPVDGLGDEAWWWEDVSRPGGGLVLRVGGSAASIDLGGQFGDRLSWGAVPPTAPESGDEGETVRALNAQEITVEIFRRLRALGDAVAQRLEPTPFDQGEPEAPPGDLAAPTTIGEEVCSILSLDAMSADMAVSTEGAALSPLGERGCTYSNDQGVNVTVELVGTGVPESALELGREMTIDGETVVWEPELVADLGDLAIWMVDPMTGTTGELYALFDDALVRVSSSGPSPDRVKERAVAAMRLAGADLADLDVGEP